MALPLEKSVSTRHYYTAAEFITLPLDPAKRYELVQGELKEMSHPGREHTLIIGLLMKALIFFAANRNLGEVLPPGGFELKLPGQTKDTVRSPDLAFLRAERVNAAPGSFTETPDLAVEVYSPNDRPGDLQEKLEDYQQAGWPLVWVIYPPTATPSVKPVR